MQGTEPQPTSEATKITRAPQTVDVRTINRRQRRALGYRGALPTEASKTTPLFMPIGKRGLADLEKLWKGGQVADTPPEEAPPAQPQVNVASLEGLRFYWWPESVEAQDEFSRAHVTETCWAAKEEVAETRHKDRMRSGHGSQAARAGLTLCQECANDMLVDRLDGVVRAIDRKIG